MRRDSPYLVLPGNCDPQAGRDNWQLGTPSGPKLWLCPRLLGHHNLHMEFVNVELGHLSGRDRSIRPGI